MNYYCARLLVICLVDDGRPRKKNLCDYPFVIFRAKDEKEAFDRALELGKEQETTYKNNKGERVRWALDRVEQIKKLGRKLDGMEVGSLLEDHISEKPIPYRRRFRPEKHEPYYD